MKNKEQRMRYTDEELGLMKAVFAEDREKLYIIRKVMFQFPLTDEEKSALQSFVTEPVFALMKKTFVPYLEPDAPLFQMSNLVLGLGADTKSLSPDGAWPFIKAKELEVSYIEQQLKALHGESEQKIILSELTSLDYPKAQREQVYINILAWNFLLSFIDSNIQQIMFLAGLKHETVEQTMVRLRSDSAK